jgi:hypothetical protein
MKIFKIALVALVMIANFAIAKPSWADRPRLTNLPDYAEVTQSLTDLLNGKQSPEQSGLNAEEIAGEIGKLQLQKYILESARGWSQCSNETGKTLPVYAHKPKKSAPTQEGKLFYLGDGKVTEDEWNCDGVYLPSGAKVAGLTLGDTQGIELTQPVALKIVPGTQLVAKTNVDSGAIEFNVPPAKVFKAGETTLPVPELSLAEVDAQIPNAPIED